MKKTLIAIAALFVCYLINLWLGLILTLGAISYLLIKNIDSIYGLLGSRAYAESKKDKAIKWYEKAIASGKASASVRINYAMILLRTGNPKRAEEEFNAVISNKAYSEAEKRSAKEYRCMAYLKQGNTELAYSEAKALFQDIKNTITYGIIGYLMQLVETTPEEHLALCEEAYDYNSDDRDITDNLVVALIRNNELDRASELAADLRDNHPTFVEAFYHSALIELKRGNKDLAKEYLLRIKDCRRSYLTTVSEDEIELLCKEAE